MTPADDSQRKPERVERTYYLDGSLKEEIHYRGVSPHGLWRQWHPNGRIAGEWCLDKGVYIEGTNRTWYPDGMLQSEFTYVNGKQISSFFYSPAGKLLPSDIDLRRKGLRKMIAKAKSAKHRRPAKREPDDEARSLTQVQNMLAALHFEARDWLKASSESALRNLGEMDPELSLELVEALYDLGAAAVLAVEVVADPFSLHQTTNHLLVRLPQDPDARPRIFAFDRAHARSRGFESEGDRGQEYIYMLLC